MTNVPSATFGPAGFAAPAESAILAGVQADQNAAFGGNVNPALTTGLGQLAMAQAACIGNANALFLALANGVDPAYASGRLQDGIGRIYFLTRIAAAPTVAQVACSGLPGVVIPAGALLQAADGTLYAATGAGTIPASGVVSLPFAAQTLGAIACPAQSFTIFRAIPGWDSAVSTQPGVEGNPVETRAAFEARRAASVAINAQGSVPAIRGAILAVPGVLSAVVIDNPSPAPLAIGGVTIPARSLYCSVSGGAAADIAAAIWSRKSLGCATSGGTTIIVYDTASPSTPLPSYAISFDVQTPAAILFAVSIANSPSVPANAPALIQAAVASAMAGGDGGPRAQAGATLYASRFYAPIAALGAWAQIVSLLLGPGSPTLYDYAVPINEAPTTSASNITVSLV